jgi:radical SAM protein with 4Fe4S-binding SPASM domain
MLEPVDSLVHGARLPGRAPEPRDEDVPWFLPRPPRLRESGDALLDRTIRADRLLRPAQHANLRAMADDLFLRRSIWNSVPVRLLFEFNRRCNVKCVHCDIRRVGTQDLGLDVFERVLDAIGHGAFEVMPIVGGEPTLAPIEGAAALCRRYGQWLNFITNGILFTREWFEPIADVTARVQFSLHAHERERFARVIPGADFDVVVRNVRDVAAIGRQRGMQVLACIVPMFGMLERLHEYVRFVAELGVDRIIVQNLYPHTTRKAALDPEGMTDPGLRRDAFARALEAAIEVGVHVETNVPELWGDPRNVPRERSRFDLLQDSAELVAQFAPEFCISTAMQAVIEHDGTVLPCIRDRIPLGNVHRQPFLELWNGEVMQSLRESHFRATPRPACRSCRSFYLGHP